MAKNKNNSKFLEVFEEHPIKSCIGCSIFSITLTYFLLALWYDSKIENITTRYEDKIENLKKSHEQDLQINEVKLQKEEGTKYYLNIDPNSKMANEISSLIKNGNNEK